MENTENIQILNEAVSSMAKTDAVTLTAALALLPDYREDGEMIVIAAATRVAASLIHDDKDMDKFLSNFKKSIENYKEFVKGND